MKITNLPIQFCCLGPQRTASSWLQEVLQCHDDLCLPKGVKETMFFDSRFAKGIDWYTWHFKHAEPNQTCGEIAPTYFDSPEACDRLANLRPDLKIIIMVRHPVDRTFSLYRHHLSKGRIRVSFEEALAKHPDIVTSGKYSQHAAYWESAFPQDQFLYIWQDQIRTDPNAILDRACDFIGVERMELPDIAHKTINHATAPRSKLLAFGLSSMASYFRSLRLHRLVDLGKSIGLKSVYNSKQTVEPMSEQVSMRLLAEFEPDIRWLENRFGRDLSSWRTNSFERFTK